MREWFEVLFGPELAMPLAWVAAALILALLLYIFFRIARRFTAGTFVSGGRSRMPRLAVVDAAAIDAHRRLVLVRRDDVEHLILIGGGADIVVEQDIRAAGRRAELEDLAEDMPVQAQPMAQPMAAIAPISPPPPAAAEPEPPVVFEPEPPAPTPEPEPVRPAAMQQASEIPEPAADEASEIAATRAEPTPSPVVERPDFQRPSMTRFQVPSRGPAAGTALAAAAAATVSPTLRTESETPVQTEFSAQPEPDPEPELDMTPQWHRPRPTDAAASVSEVGLDHVDLVPEDEAADRLEPDQAEPAEEEPFEYLRAEDLQPPDAKRSGDLEPSEDLEPMVELDTPRPGAAAFAAPSLDEAARGGRVEPEFFPPSREAPQPEPASDLDAALLRELEASLDHPEKARTGDPVEETSLEDEMAKLLGSLSRERR